MIDNVTTRLNNIEEACQSYGRISSDFTTINASIEALQNEMIQRYTVAQRMQPVKTDQLSVASQSEISSQSHASSSGSSGSGPIIFRGISLTVWTRFKQLFDQIRDEKGFNSEMCLLVAMEIHNYGGKIKKNTVKGFMRDISRRKMVSLAH